MMINKQKLVNPENLPVIEWQGVRVVTTETLAAGYGTTPIRIQQNYIRNEDRFVEGKHFFKISGDELKSFRLSFSESVNKHTTSLVLWTERGAARMSKIVDTDEAWLFFEKMEQAYFRKATPSSNTIPDFDDPIAAAEAWIEAKKSERLALGYAERQARYISKLESHLADGITPVQFCKQLNGVNTRQINAFLEERNWLYDDRPEAMCRGSQPGIARGDIRRVSVFFIVHARARQNYGGLGRGAERLAGFLERRYCEPCSVHHP